MFETYVTVVGNLITAVNRRQLPDGTAVANFRIASNERRFDRDAGAWVDGDSLYLPVSCWRQLAENVHTTFSVGDPVIVRGRLHSRSYDDKDGKRQTVVELEALTVGADLSRAVAKLTRLRRDGTAVPAPSPAAEAGAGARESDDPWPGTDQRGASVPGDRAGGDLGARVEAGVGG